MSRILIADDEPGVREFLEDALDAVGHDVTTTRDGIEAVMAIRRQPFDVCITDLNMPGADGLTVLQAARDHQPDLAVVLLTAHGSVDTAVKAMKLGAYDYLEKPLSSLDALRSLVEKAAEYRSERFEAERTPSVASTTQDTPLTWGAPAMKPVVQALSKVARTSATVLLLGESGVGKEVAARALVAQSKRADKPLSAINCAALTADLLESELFGHEKGAFTGASNQRRGRLELTDGGTLFLDEVGELRLDLQAKLLRVLEESTFERVGGSETIEVDVRWVAATNRDLRAMVEAGQFRDDLYHRLAVFPIHLPPLRQRRKDIPDLADTLLRRVADDLDRPGLKLTAEASDWLKAQAWPGNIRELRNTLERAAILAEGEVLDPDVFELAALAAGGRGAADTGVAGHPQTLEELEKQAIIDALASVDGHRKNAAEQLGIGLRTLYDKIKRYGIE